MDLRRLQLFLAVAEHGGFTRAASAVFISQPALSQGIKELEAELGVKLFHRLGRRVSLTSAGEALLGPARQALRDVEAGRMAVESVLGLQSGRLDLGSLPSLAADPLATMVGAFRRSHTGVTVIVSSPRNPAELVRLLQEGVCELGITEAFEVPKSLTSIPLVTQEMVAVLPPGTEPTSDPFSLEELAKLPIVSTPMGTSTRRALDEAFARAGLTAHVAVVSAQRDAILPMVLAGAGAAILPRSIASTPPEHGATVLGLHPKITREIVIAHRPAVLSPAAAAFIAAA
ncbi:MAG: LysR substrate-binding domain-containing protein [Actinomycetota bacterium]